MTAICQGSSGKFLRCHNVLRIRPLPLLLSPRVPHRPPPHTQAGRPQRADTSTGNNQSSINNTGESSHNNNDKNNNHDDNVNVKKTQRRLTQADPGQESRVTDKHVIVTRVVFTSIYKCLLPSLDRDIGLLPSLDRDIGYLHYLCECEDFLLCKIHRKCLCEELSL